MICGEDMNSFFQGWKDLYTAKWPAMSEKTIIACLQTGVYMKHFQQNRWNNIQGEP